MIKGSRKLYINDELITERAGDFFEETDFVTYGFALGLDRGDGSDVILPFKCLDYGLERADVGVHLLTQGLKFADPVFELIYFAFQCIFVARHGGSCKNRHQNGN